MSEEMIGRLVHVRVRIDEIESALDTAGPEELDRFGEELLSFRSELRTIYNAEKADFEELAAKHEGQLGQDDLNSLEETLEAAEETAEIIMARRAALGEDDDDEEHRLEDFADRVLHVLDEVDALPGEDTEDEPDVSE